MAYWNHFAEDTRTKIMFKDIAKISALEQLSIKEFLTYRNAGKSTLNELAELCHCVGISLLP
jgi:hypothetical protein